MVLIKPYYRDNRLQTINNIVNTIENDLLNNTTKEDIDEVEKLTISNNVCALIYNEKGKSIYYKNSLGELCTFDKPVRINDEEIVVSEQPEAIIRILSLNKVISIETKAMITNASMLLYGKKISNNLANYYLLVNTPLEPVESYVDFILSQYLFLAIIAVVFSLIVAFYLAKTLSSPIVNIQKEAKKLAEGNYDANFKVNDSYAEINELASTLDNATDKLGKIDELRKDLIANVSHDIKTPLTMIKAYAEMIRDISGDNPEKRNEHIDVILKETDYLTKLVTDMQELSKMQAGVIELNNSNFDLQDVIEDVLELLNHFAESRKVKLNSETESCIIYGDEIKISQVIYNFVSNAIKHSSEGSEVLVKMTNNEESVKVEVIDKGEGIKEELLPYIWDRYNKIDKGFARSKESTGLGLAIAKAILEAHKAKYGVVSKENEGSTFYFELSKDYETEVD